MYLLPYSLLHLLAITLISITILPCANAKQTAHDDLTFQAMTYNGLQRTYYLHLPPQHSPTVRLPLVLALHGGGRADGDELAKRTGYNQLADQEGFIAVYPNGIDAQWNDGRGKTARKPDRSINIDDVGFLSTLIDHLIRDYNADPRRVYMTGLSNGGMMTLRMGCEAGSKLAAIAPVIANMPVKIANSCRPGFPLPLLLMNGTRDPMVPWQGGAVRFFRKEMGQVLSTEETIQFWKNHNQCRALPDVEILPDIDESDHSTVRVVSYRCPDNYADVVLYTIDGGGHNFPGSHTPDLPRLLGNKNNDINGPEVIWQFFMRYKKPPLT